MAERKSILVRLRPETYAALQRWAADEFRSVNGQIEYILDQALGRAGRRPRPGAAGAGDRLAAGPGVDPQDVADGDADGNSRAEADGEPDES